MVTSLRGITTKIDTRAGHSQKCPLNREGKKMDKELKSWQVEYSATYWVKAESEDEAIELAMEEHYKSPDGDWQAELEAWPPVEIEEASA
jgi:hypothetical protein